MGVIGCGHWGPNHVRNFAAHPSSEVVAIADVEAKRLAAVRALYPQVTAYQDYQALLHREDIDAVVVATPTRTHVTVVTDGLAAGKHVLCEKPLCLSAGDGLTLVQMAAAHQRMLMVGHVFLFNSAVIKLKELIDSGTLGELHYLASVCRKRTAISATSKEISPWQSDWRASSSRCQCIRS